MRDMQKYLSKSMFYSIFVTNLIQLLVTLVIAGCARHNLSKLSSALTCTAIPNCLRRLMAALGIVQTSLTLLSFAH